MNPQDPSVTPPAPDAPTEASVPTTPAPQPTAEADVAALQAIDALESESPAEGASFGEPAETTTPVEPAIEAPASAEPVVAEPFAPVSPVDATPVEAPVVDAVQDGASFQSTTEDATQTTPVTGVAPAPSKKSPLLLILIIAVVVVGVAAGYFIWQSL